MKSVITIVLSLLFVTTLVAQNQIKKKDLKKGIYAQITTNKGDILVKLDPENAPLTVANFVGLATGNLTLGDSITIDQPYYDGLTFHRVISRANGDAQDFMIQGGDPEGTGRGGPGYQFWNETDNDLKHDKGVISMANAGPNTNGSQFFITVAPAHHLNGGYNIFGKVVKGQEVADEIVIGDKMKKINIISKGLKYSWFYNPTKIFKKEYAKIAEKQEAERLRMSKMEAQNKVRLAEAKSKSHEEYKEFFYEMIKEQEPQAKQTESGLVYVVRKKGTGDVPEKGDAVSLHYKGTLIYGPKFDSSYDRGQPLNFNYKVQNMIPGFNEGIGLSNKGQKIDLFIPYFLGYGQHGSGASIPPYSDLLFEVEILEVGDH